MKQAAAFLLLLGSLAAFAVWQIRDGAQKDARLEAQTAQLEALATRAKHIDEALQGWRRENERIAAERQEKREITKTAARRDKTFQEHLALPLHGALLPGGGLLGKKGTAPAAARSGGAAAGNPGP